MKKFNSRIFVSLLVIIHINKIISTTSCHPSLVTKDALGGLAIGIALTTIIPCTASLAIVTYAVMTFDKVGTNWDVNVSSIVLMITLIFGSLTTTYLADKLGRRKLNLMSLMGCACGLLSTSSYYYLNLCGYNLSTFGWFPVFSLCLVVFSASAGIGSLAFVCSIENLGPKVSVNVDK